MTCAQRHAVPPGMPACPYCGSTDLFDENGAPAPVPSNPPAPRPGPSTPRPPPVRRGGGGGAIVLVLGSFACMAVIVGIVTVLAVVKHYQNQRDAALDAIFGAPRSNE